jgi:hypothetical protein
MSDLQFDATEVGWHEELGTISAGAQRSEGEASEYVLLQRSPNENELYVEINDQSRSAYGAVTDVRLCRESLELVLEPKVGGSRLPRNVFVGLNAVPADRVRNFAQILSRVTKDVAQFRNEIEHKIGDT